MYNVILVVDDDVVKQNVDKSPLSIKYRTVNATAQVETIVQEVNLVLGHFSRGNISSDWLVERKSFHKGKITPQT